MNSVNAAQLALWVSGDRLKRYGDHPGATVDLYVHNAHRASVMIEVLQHVEVLVRNVIHRELSANRQHAGIPWYLDTARFGFSHPMQGKLSHAVSAAGGPGATGGKVVAELMFGTWRYLLSSQYQSTVWAVVSRGFHGVPRSQRKREELYNSMTYLNTIRNRCSHAEPVYPVPTTVFLTHVCTVARYISPDAAAWLHDLWFERTGNTTLALLDPGISAATP